MQTTASRLVAIAQYFSELQTKKTAIYQSRQI